MKHATKIKMFALALCIANIFCFGQQGRTAVCRLGDITNDSLLSSIRSLEITGNKDAELFTKKSERLSSLNTLTIKGELKENQWNKVFQKLKGRPAIETVIFDSNNFTTLPEGYEGLNSAVSLQFINNNDLDHFRLIQQLSALPNLTSLTIEINTIYDIPANLNSLKALTNLSLINTDEAISGSDPLAAFEKEPVTYDYYLKENDRTVSVKYTAKAGEIDSDEYAELSKRFMTTNNFTEEPAGFIPKYANVKPPIKGIDVERTVYTLNPQIENVITYPSGTKIRIPANTFINMDGTPVTTTVKLCYREFRDPVDFLVSGIPMKYDTAGTVTNFESAGMFELSASAADKPIQIAATKKVDMNFATTSKDSTYNFYSFSDSSDNWDYLNKPTPITKATTIPFTRPSQAFLIYQNYVLYNEPIYDSTTFAKRFEDTSYVYTNLKTNGRGNRMKYRLDGKSRTKSMYSLVKINRVRKVKDGTVLFKVSYLNNSHPEMNEFSDTYFALNEPMSAADFRQKYARRKSYNDIRVITSGADVEVKLKDNNSIKSISAELVTLTDKGEVKEVKNAAAKIKRYNKRLHSREKYFDKRLSKGKLDDNILAINDPRRLSEYGFAKAKKFMTADEKKMNYTEWVDYCKRTEEERAEWQKKTNAERLGQLANAEANAGNLVESLSLTGMGIYNCDQIQRMKQPVEVFAKYETPDAPDFRVKETYIIDKAANSVFQYNGGYGYSPSKIAFSKSAVAENTLLAINDSGEIAIYKTADFKKHEFSNKSHFDFVVTKINSKFTSVGELKTLIGF